MPGHQSSGKDALANNLLGRGRPSTWIARLAWRRLTSEVSGDPVSSVLCGRRRFNCNNSGPIDSESAEDPWQAAIHWVSHPHRRKGPASRRSHCRARVRTCALSPRQHGSSCTTLICVPTTARLCVVLLALLPAWAGPWFINCKDAKA